jgi:predicted  nucleic acid-binding Zn-ribbon protein
VSIARQLFNLQSIELEIESKEQALVQSQARLGESRELLAAREERLKAGQRLEALEKKQHDAEWEIEDIAGKLQKIEQALYSGSITNPKELASLQHEADGFKNRRCDLEESTLEIMEQVEMAVDNLENLSREIEEVEAKWRQEQQQLSADIEQLINSLSALKDERQAALAAIDTEALGVYNRLRQQKGLAVARVEQGTCRGCRISLSTAELQRVKGERLVMCGSCGRILFID